MDRDGLLSSAEFWLVNFQVLLSEELSGFQKKKGLSRAQLASELGFSPRFIAQVLNAEVNCRISMLSDLSVKLGLAPEICFVPLLKAEGLENSHLHSEITIDPELDKIPLPKWAERKAALATKFLKNHPLPIIPTEV